MNDMFLFRIIYSAVYVYGTDGVSDGLSKARISLSQSGIETTVFEYLDILGNCH